MAIFPSVLLWPTPGASRDLRRAVRLSVSQATMLHIFTIHTDLSFLLPRNGISFLLVVTGFA